MLTFGYPYLPTKTAGGEDPAISFDVTFNDGILVCTLSISGQWPRPQRSLPPLHMTHRLLSTASGTIGYRSKIVLLGKMVFLRMSESGFFIQQTQF